MDSIRVIEEKVVEVDGKVYKVTYEYLKPKHVKEPNRLDRLNFKPKHLKKHSVSPNG